MKKKAILTLILVLSFTMLTSCLEDLNKPSIDDIENDFLYLVSYIETNNGFFTSDTFPAIVDVDELNQNIGNYLILDIRESDKFSEGHIPTSKNIDKNLILDYLSTNEIDNYQKIVIVSQTGHTASYVATILRILNYNNVYVLDYGLSYWNNYFSNDWIEAERTSPIVRFYKNNYSPPLTYSIYDRPNNKFDDSDLSFSGKIESRADKLLKTDLGEFEILGNDFDNLFDVRTKKYPSNIQVLFFGNENIFTFTYYISKILTYLNNPNQYYSKVKYFTLRPKGSVQFGSYPQNSFSISEKLLALPASKKIIIYSSDGQSACSAVAYLRLLGYNAYYVRFGTYTMFAENYYNYEIEGTIDQLPIDPRIGSRTSIDTTTLISPVAFESFNENNIRTYEIETGN